MLKTSQLKTTQPTIRPMVQPKIPRPKMPIKQRAKQFMPFAALNGYEDAVKETARLTEKRIEIDDGLKQILKEMGASL